MRETIQDFIDIQERRREAFHMVLGNDGVWKWSGEFCPTDEYNELLDKYNGLLRYWNKYLHLFNGPQDVGRPLEASKGQCAQVLKMHKASMSLRKIAFETNLGVRTVRTIIGRENRTDRTSKQRLERVQVDRQLAVRHRARKFTRDALPKQMAEWDKRAKELLKQ
jgi:hypothetical protein